MTNKRRQERRTLLIGGLIMVALAGPPPTAHAQTTIPLEALAAEGRGEWEEALRLYHAILALEPSRVELWLRSADIYAHLGQAQESIAALQRAVQAKPAEPELYARLSRAYAANGNARAALASMQGALALRPEDPAFLKAAGELATWAGNYEVARGSYEAVLRLASLDRPALLSLARVYAWEGQTDRASAAYKRYLQVAPEDSTAWLEAARTESWRGNDAGAVALLDQYRGRHGESDAYHRERAAILTRARRPQEALATLKPLIDSGGGDFSLTAVHTLALVEQGDEARAERAFASIPAADRARPEAENLRRQLRNAFASFVSPAASAYSDSDGLRSYRAPIALSWSALPGVRMLAGYERQELRARADSGLERIDGGAAAGLDRAWAGADLRPWPAFSVRLQGGRDDSTSRQLWAWSAGAGLRISDGLRVDYDRERSLLSISPRAVSLGITRDADHVRVSWTPSLRIALDVVTWREALSDGNERRSIRFAPRTAVVRNQHWNLDLGASVSLFGAERNLTHGYYDPSLYESYGLIAAPYLKLAENTGLSLFLEAGVQRDDTMDSFEPGGSAAAELTIGIYRRWMLKFHGSGTFNSRLESGAFRGASSGVALVRRF